MKAGLVAVFAVMSLSLTSLVSAEEGSGMSGVAVQQVQETAQAVAEVADAVAVEAQDAVAAVEVVAEPMNKICPLSGKEVTSMGAPYVVEHGGKKYNLCCPMCEAAFMEDPDKYAKLVDDQMKNAAAMAEPVAEETVESAPAAVDPQPEAAQK
jgi:YHS domain-containing protein